MAHLIQQTRAKVFDLKASETARAGAVDELSTLDTAGSSAVLWELLEPRQPLAVQTAALRALGETLSTDVGERLPSMLRRFEPQVRATAV